MLMIISPRLVPSYLRTVQYLLTCCDQHKIVKLDIGWVVLVPTGAELADIVYVLPGV